MISKQIGPLPLWGWVTVVLAAYVVYKFVLKGSSGNGNTTSDGTTPNEDIGSAAGNSGNPTVSVDLAGSLLNPPLITDGNIQLPTVGTGTTGTTNPPPTNNPPPFGGGGGGGTGGGLISGPIRPGQFGFGGGNVV